MVKKNPHESDVDLILDDIRDTLAPQKNPHCTFTTRRHDKRIQERLVDLSESDDSSKWNNLVYSQDEEQTTIGWENINPYPKYVEKRLVQKDTTKRSRFTNPVDNSTIVRHLQERIRKWADRKPGQCLYTKKSYTQSKEGQLSNYSVSKVAVVSAVDLPGLTQDPHNPQSAIKQSVDASSSVAAPDAASSTAVPDKFPVTWNLLNQNDAAHLNLQYGIDANVTYVPARRPTSHITNYTASKQHEQQQKTPKHPALRGGGVLHPARIPNYRSYRKKGNVGKRPHPDRTKDLTEDQDEDHAGYIRYRDKFKCSICIEGLQVADWPPDVDYSAGYSSAPVKNETVSYQPYKEKKLVDDSLTRSGLLVERTVRMGDSVRHGDGVRRRQETGSKATRHGLKQLVIKDRSYLPPTRTRKGGRKISKPVADYTSIALRGVATERKPSQKGENKRPENTAPSLYERFQASQSGRRHRKMYGVSICDVYESKQNEDVFSYGLFLGTPLSTPPSQQKLDPLMNIGPVTRDLEGH